MFTSRAGQSDVRRRMTPDELVAAVRADRGVELVEGFGRLVSGRGVRRYGDGRPVASAGLLTSAYLIDQRGGELEWDTAPVRISDLDVVFVFPMALGHGSATPQPSGRFELFLADRRLLAFTTTKDSQMWHGAGCTLCFAVFDVRATAFGQQLVLDEMVRDESVFVDGLALLRVPARMLAQDQPARLRVTAVNRQESTHWFRLGVPRQLLATHDVHTALEEADRAAAATHVGEHRLLFGDLHNHSAESLLLDHDGCGWGRRRELFDYARDLAGLDLFCLSEHDWQMNDEDWADLSALTDEFHEPGRFVTLPGYEWTSPAYGHRNVYFRDAGAALFGSTRPGSPRNVIDDAAPTPRDLWRHLDAGGVPALTVPHHMSVAWFPLSLEHFHHPGYDRVAEIYSCWGDSLEHGEPVSSFAHRVPELAFVNALRQGHRVGFIASSDSHDGHPGNSQGKPGHEQLFHHLGSGRVAVLAASADRHAVFDALTARRCYALTGGRIVIDASLDDHPMGSEVARASLDTPPTLHVQVRSSVPLAEVAIYRNGHRVDTLTAPARDAPLHWADERPPDGPATSYFAKVIRTDGEMAWTSPIWSSNDRPRGNGP